MRKVLSGALALAMMATSAVTLSAPAEARGWHGGGHHGGYHGGYNGGGHYGWHGGYGGGWNGYRGGNYGGGYGWHHRRHYGGDIAAAAIIGLAAGAYIANSGPSYHRTYYANRGYYDRGYDDRGYNGGSHVSRCEANYRSYDPRSDTFIGSDGREYYCNL